MLCITMEDGGVKDEIRRVDTIGEEKRRQIRWKKERTRKIDHAIIKGSICFK